jgi:hypothetical protein
MTANSPELDETLRKIGRNVFLFQRMELMLKFLIPRASLSGTKSTLKDNLEHASAAVSKQTMGNLLNPFLEAVYGENVPLEDMPGEVQVAFSLRIEASEEERLRQQQALERLVEQRNELIHHRLAHLKPDSSESCIALGKELDEQFELLKPEYERLRSLGKALVSASKQVLKEGLVSE